ncbi:MAG: hypothetical protein RSF67_01255 [Clostridia bacterium]
MYVKIIGIKTSEDITLPDYETYFSEDSYFTDVIFNDISSYDENIPLLNKYNITSSYNLYRSHMCNIDSLFFFDNSKYVDDIVDVVNAIHNAGGIAILAHPFNVYKVIDKKKFLDDIISLNILDGIECIHKCIYWEESDYLINLCNKNNLYITGGSDYHNVCDKIGYANYMNNKITMNNIDKFLGAIKNEIC